MERRQLGGIGFLISNAALAANGFIASRFAPTPESRKAGISRMTSAVLWSGSSAFMAHYGDRPVDAQADRLQQKLAEYLKLHGVPLEVEALRKADAATQHGWFQNVEDFFYAHPIECANAYNTLMASGFAISGMLRRRDGNMKAGNANLGLSALFLTGALASILIPEKTPEQIAQKGQTGTLWGKIQEHPLGYVRWLFLAADSLAGMEALGEYQSARKLPKGDPYRNWQFGMAGLSVAAMATAIVSDCMTSGSKKAGGTPESRDAAQAQMLQLAAQQIAALPAPAQQRLAQDIATYLTQQHELRFQDRDPKQLAGAILQQVAALTAPQTTKRTVGAHTQKLSANAHEAVIQK